MRFSQLTPRFPLLAVALLILLTGWLLLDRAAAQARDTARKHHLDDIEHALYAAYREHDTFPPYDQPSWCGRLNDPKNAAIKVEVETALRQYNDKYGKQEKPFPRDPLVAGIQGADLSAEALPAEQTGSAKARALPDYFYWKHSPAVFELYSMLEAAPTSERSTNQCPADSNQVYDYGIRSYDRQPF